MKITFEFNTDNENFDYHELEIHKQAADMASCLFEIQNKLRGWYKYDERGEIPTEEVFEKINEIIVDHVNMEKMGY